MNSDSSNIEITIPILQFSEIVLVFQNLLTSQNLVTMDFCVAYQRYKLEPKLLFLCNSRKFATEKHVLKLKVYNYKLF